MAVVLNVPTLWLDCSDGYHLDCWCIVYGRKVIKCLLCSTPIWIEEA